MISNVASLLPPKSFRRAAPAVMIPSSSKNHNRKVLWFCGEETDDIVDVNVAADNNFAPASSFMTWSHCQRDFVWDQRNSSVARARGGGYGRSGAVRNNSRTSCSSSAIESVASKTSTNSSSSSESSSENSGSSSTTSTTARAHRRLRRKRQQLPVAAAAAALQSNNSFSLQSKQPTFRFQMPSVVIIPSSQQQHQKRKFFSNSSDDDYDDDDSSSISSISCNDFIGFHNFILNEELRDVETGYDADRNEDESLSSIAT